MTPEEEEYINSIPAEEFFLKCQELWEGEGSPVLDGMHEIITEAYNNAAIDEFKSEMPEDEDDE